MLLEKRIDYICERLPLGWEIRIDLERGAGNVTAVRPNGTEVNMGDGETDIEEQISSAFHLAHDEIAAENTAHWSNKTSEQRDDAARSTEQP